MKTLRTIVLSAVSGALAAMLVERVFERRKGRDKPPANKAEARTSRSIGEIAPSFSKLEHKFVGDDRSYNAHRDAWIAFVREAVRPGLTELEANQIAQAILEYEPPGYNYVPESLRLWEDGLDEMDGEDKS